MSLLPRVLESDNPVPRMIIGYISARSQGGTSFIDADVSEVAAFYGSDSDRGEALRAAESAGLEVLAESRLGVAVAGAPEAFPS